MSAQQLSIGDLVTSEAVRRAFHRSPLHKQRGRSKGDTPAEEQFAHDCRRFRLPQPIAQFELVKSVQTPRRDGKKIPRRWRFDFAWPDLKLIVEIDGGIWMKGGGAHSHPIDLTRNMQKRNDAGLCGFVILAFTPKEVRSGAAIDFVQRVLAGRNRCPTCGHCNLFTTKGERR